MQAAAFLPPLRNPQPKMTPPLLTSSCLALLGKSFMTILRSLLWSTLKSQLLRATHMAVRLAWGMKKGGCAGEAEGEQNRQRFR